MVVVWLIRSIVKEFKHHHWYLLLALFGVPIFFLLSNSRRNPVDAVVEMGSLPANDKTFTNDKLRRVEMGAGRQAGAELALRQLIMTSYIPLDQLSKIERCSEWDEAGPCCSSPLPPPPPQPQWTDVFRLSGGATRFIGIDQLDALRIAEAQMCLSDDATGVSSCIPLNSTAIAQNLPPRTADGHVFSVNEGLLRGDAALKRVIAVLSGQDLDRIPQWYCPDWDGGDGACTTPECQLARCDEQAVNPLLNVLKMTKLRPTMHLSRRRRASLVRKTRRGAARRAARRGAASAPAGCRGAS